MILCTFIALKYSLRCQYAPLGTRQLYRSNTKIEDCNLWYRSTSNESHGLYYCEGKFIDKIYFESIYHGFFGCIFNVNYFEENAC